MEATSLSQSEIKKGLQRFAQYYNSQTNIGTFRSTGRSSLLNEGLSTRANSIWKMAEYIIAYFDTSDKPTEDYLTGWKTLASNFGDQYLFLEVEPSVWQLYDAQGNLLGGNDYIPTFFNEKFIEKQASNQAAQKNCIPAILDDPLQLIYYGAPGTGKSFKVDEIANDKNSVRTTFHPDTDYASFVGAYKPTMQPVGLSYVSDGFAKFAKATDKHPGSENKIVYKYVPQAFLKAYVAAWSNLDQPYYLVIEEINRGNCAQIFGDLFQLLDRNNQGASSYPINADEDIKQFLAASDNGDSNGFSGLSEEQQNAIRSFILVTDRGDNIAIGEQILNGTKLLLPPNLRIWATMNTSDQSLFPIDSAFKRRWNWEYIAIDYDKENWQFEVAGKRYLWGDFLRKMNPIITRLTDSSDKQMGYYFAKANPKTGVISEKIFLNKVLFYLWTDVLKDYSIGEAPFLDPDTKKPYTFTGFFDQPETLAKFVEGLELKVMGDAAAEEELKDTTAPEEINPKLSVSFPDGEVVNTGTQASIYIASLKKIGLERAAEVFDKKGYKLPLIAKETVETSGSKRRYQQVDDWFVLLGPDTYPYYPKLQILNSELNLGLEIAHQ